MCSTFATPDKNISLKMSTSAITADLLISLELQAMELGLRTLIEFTITFCHLKQQLTQIILEESKHFKVNVLRGIEFGFKWGEWPTHQKNYGSALQKLMNC